MRPLLSGKGADTMATQAKLSDYGISVGTLPSGPLGKISDVPGVTVGHCTVDTQTQKTGVTVVMPCADDMFAQKLPAAACVLNGFGKTAGLVQIGELGTLETPIALTNTLNVGLVYDAMVEYMVGRCAQSGTALRSVNPVVAECNDGGLNDIARRAVRQEHVFAALENARADFEEGDVGAGKGMVCARAGLPCTVLHEGRIVAVFRAMGEATEEAVLRAMLCADTVTGFDGSTKYTIRNFVSQIS